MDSVGNIELYSDDNEIIEVVSRFPRMKQHGNITLLKFVQDKTVDKDFFTMLDFEGKVYAFYKFDTKSMKSEEDGGLLMSASKPEHVLEQVKWWKKAKEVGMDFRPGLFTQMENALTGRFGLYLMKHGGKK